MSDGPATDCGSTRNWSTQSRALISGRTGSIAARATCSPSRTRSSGKSSPRSRSQLSPSEQARLNRPPTSNLEAYDSFLRAERAARSGFRPEFRNALALYAKATQLDPDFADAFAAHARTAAYIWANNYDDVLPAPVARREAYDMASRAVQLDPETPLPYAVLAVLQVFDRQYEEAIASARRAVALGPSDADAYAALGLVLTFAGEHAQAMQAVDEALRLDPSPAIGDRLTAGLAYSLGGDHKRAIEVLEQARATAARVDDVHRALAIAYARAGQMDDARAAAMQVARLQPDLNVRERRGSITSIFVTIAISPPCSTPPSGGRATMAVRVSR